MKRINIRNAKRPGSNESYFNSQGRMNASTNKEAIETFVKLQSLIASGSHYAKDNDDEVEGVLGDKELIAAYNSTNSDEFTVIGAEMGEAIYEQASRTGMARNFLKQYTAGQGDQYIRIPIYTKNVTIVKTTGADTVMPQYIRDNFVTLQEIDFVANVLVTPKELREGPGDLLARKYEEMFEASAVNEDRLFIKGLDATVGIENPQVAVSSLTPGVLQRIAETLHNNATPPSAILLAANLQSQLVNGDFNNSFSEIDKFEVTRTGRLNTIYGFQMYFEPTNYRPGFNAMRPNTMYAISTPEYLGGYSDRGAPLVRETMPGENNNPGRGWFMTYPFGLIIANARAVVKGIII